MGTAIGNQARETIQAYMARTGITMGQVAREAGLAYQTARQFMSDCYPHDENPLARSLLEFVEKNPPEVEDVPGKLYETENVRILDRQIAAAWDGQMSLIYGPPGTQKTFVFKRRVAEFLQRDGLTAPRMGYVYAGALMGRLSLPAAIARSFACYVRATAHQAINNLVHEIRRRKRRHVLIVDEAQHLGAREGRERMALLECLRELTDRADVGLVLAGHDALEEIFNPETSPLEQFVQRIDFRLRLPGLQEKEVREIATAELGALSEKALGEILKACETRDQHRGQTYYAARYLFKVIAQVRARRRKAN